MTETEIEKFRNEIFKSGYERNRKWKEKLTGWIKPAELETAYPASIRLRLEEQRHSLRDILIEGNNLLPWREPTTDLDELEKELTVYAGKRHSKDPGDGFAEYAFDIVRRIRLYRDKEVLIEIEKEQYNKETAPDTQTPAQKPAGKLPPVIQAVLDEGLLDTPPVNGRYLKKGDKKDTNIIEWIFNFSGYGDSLTAELYMQHIQTRCKPTTIQDYITRSKSVSD
jgi:hypothetical protein